jgi:hypothetical protein
MDGDFVSVIGSLDIRILASLRLVNFELRISDFARRSVFPVHSGDKDRVRTFFESKARPAVLVRF